MKQFYTKLFRNVAATVLLLAVICLSTYSKAASGSYYALKVYHYKTAAQQQMLHTYLQQAYLPALHRNGVKQAGVFSTLEADTTDRRVYVFIPLSQLNKLEALDEALAKDKKYLADGAAYINAAYNATPYTRMETIIIKAFAGMPQPAVPGLTGTKSERIYELRSYEGPTEKYYAAKVDMFNRGNEIGLFNRLGFNAVFYGSVLAGGRMPNLMYMTVFANKADRDKHWEAFGSDAEWKTLSAKEEYKNTVSKSDIIFLQAADYSDF